MARKQQSYECPPKKFSIPPNIQTLQGYGGVIINAMHSEFSRRMSWAKTHKFRVKAKKK